MIMFTRILDAKYDDQSRGCLAVSRTIILSMINFLGCFVSKVKPEELEHDQKIAAAMKKIDILNQAKNSSRPDVVRIYIISHFFAFKHSSRVEWAGD